MALVCLLVVASIGAILLRSSLEETRGSLIRERQLQTMWLVESGLDRAIAGLAASPDYTGETWLVSSDELGQRDSATVRIVVEPVDTQRRANRITVDASYSDDPQRRVVQRRIIEVERPSTGEKS